MRDGRGARLGGKLERVEGIEPSSSAWKAAALPLSYTRNRSVTPPAIASRLRREKPPRRGALQRLVEGAGFEPAYALAGRFTVCCH